MMDEFSRYTVDIIVKNKEAQVLQKWCGQGIWFPTQGDSEQGRFGLMTIQDNSQTEPYRPAQYQGIKTSESFSRVE